MRVVVTGGAGFIGSHVVEILIAHGHQVLVVDNFWEHGGASVKNLAPEVATVRMDVLDPGLSALLADFKPELVCHHGGQHSVAIGNREPGLDAQINVIGLLNVLESAVKCGARKVIFASSAATFGNPKASPIHEDTPQLPTSPYGITKLASEHYLRFFKQEHGLDYTILRYGNVYGPRQNPSGEAGVIAVFIERFNRRQSVQIDWDGEQSRDYVFVEDVARANLLALEGGGGACYVIGTGVRTSVNQLYRALVAITGFAAPVESGQKRLGDVRHSVFDITRARTELGWSPRVELLDGIRRTVEFFQTQDDFVSLS